MDVRITTSVLAVFVSVLATPSFGQPDTTDITYDTPPVAGNLH